MSPSLCPKAIQTPKLGSWAVLHIQPLDSYNSNEKRTYDHLAGLLESLLENIDESIYNHSHSLRSDGEELLKAALPGLDVLLLAACTDWSFVSSVVLQA